MKYHSIIALSGGGARGVVSNQILRAIEARLRGPVSQYADAVFGTSTGAIQALALTRPHPYSAAALDFMYMDFIPQVFSSRKLAFGGWTGPKYDARKLEQALAEKLGLSTLGQAVCEVGVVTYSLLMREPIMLSRGANPTLHAWKAARMSSAAPTFFDAYENYVDGGLSANSPGAWGVLEYSYRFNVPLSEIHLLAIGTGTSERPIVGTEGRGKAGWVEDVIDIALGSNEDLAHAQAQEMGLASYTRSQTKLPAELSAMDATDHETLFALRDLGAKLALEESVELDAFCARLIAAKTR